MSQEYVKIKKIHVVGACLLSYIFGALVAIYSIGGN